MILYDKISFKTLYVEKISPLYTSLKVAFLTAFIVTVMQWVSFLALWNVRHVHAENTNSEVFYSGEGSDYASVGVALSTRVGTKFQDKRTSSFSSSQSFYREISSIGASPEENRAIRADMISQNMLIINEYLNLSRTNTKDLLKWSQDRRSTLESFISQLEMRYKSSALSIGSLEKQKALIVERINIIDWQIEQVKSRMETDFSAWDANATLNDVDDYFALRAEYTEAFTDVVFINQFLKQHEFLNEYNIGILDTLINNKEAIINESFIVIPDSWDQYLRPLELLFDEAEIKEQQSN